MSAEPGPSTEPIAAGGTGPARAAGVAAPPRNNRLGAHITATLGGQWIKAAIQIATVLVLTRILSPYEYGVMAMVLSITGAAVLIGDLGLATAAIQTRRLTDAQQSNLFWINTAAGALVTGIVALLARPVALFYDLPAVEYVVLAVCACFLLEGLGAQMRARATRLRRYALLATADVSAQAAALAVAVTLALLGAGVWALAVQALTLSFVRLLGVVLGVRWLPGLPGRDRDTGTLVRFGVRTAAVQTVQFVSTTIGSVLVGRFVGVLALGVYNRAYQLSRLPFGHISAPLTRVALPTLAAIDDERDFERAARRMQSTLLFVLTAILGTAAALSPALVPIFLGEKWTEVVPLLSILAIGGMFQGMVSTNYWILTARGLVKEQLRYELLGRAVGIVVTLAGLPFGALGVAVGASLGLGVSSAIVAVLAMPKIGLSPRRFLGGVLAPVLYALPGVAGSYAVTTAVVATLGALAGLGIGVLVVAAYVGLTVLVVPAVRRAFGAQTRTLVRLAPARVRRLAPARFRTVEKETS